MVIPAHVNRFTMSDMLEDVSHVFLRLSIGSNLSTLE